jgi:hypothetical protein
MPATATRRLLTATEAQIKSGRSMVRFRQWVAAGRLPFVVDDAGRRRFDAEDVDRLVAEVNRYKLEDDAGTPAIAPAATPAPTAEVPSGGVIHSDLVRILRASGAWQP